MAGIRQQLDSRLVKLQDDLDQAKLLRAEKYAEYMRNWLAILSLVITGIFVGFGILGYTRFSDVEAYRKQMASDAADVAVNAKKVADGAATVQHVMGDLQTRVGDLDKRIDGIESRSQKADQQIVSAVNRTSAVVQQTRNDLFSSVSSGIYGTDLPAVSRALLVARPAESSIEGNNFGNSPGHVYIEVQRGIGVGTSLSASVAQPPSVEIDSPFTWTNTSISFVLSSAAYQKLQEIHEKESSSSANSSVIGFTSSGSWNSTAYLTVRVANAEGRSSIFSVNVAWP
jgi:hypothetical protein